MWRSLGLFFWLPYSSKTPPHFGPFQGEAMLSVRMISPPSPLKALCSGEREREEKWDYKDQQMSFQRNRCPHPAKCTLNAVSAGFPVLKLLAVEPAVPHLFGNSLQSSFFGVYWFKPFSNFQFCKGMAGGVCRALTPPCSNASMDAAGVLTCTCLSAVFCVGEGYC